MIAGMSLGQDSDESKLVEMWVDPPQERQGWEILERYTEVLLSLTDATSAAVARRAKIPMVFGFHSDLRALGFDAQPIVP